MKNHTSPLNTHYSKLMVNLHWVIAILMVLAYLFINLKGLFVKGSDPRELMKTLHFMMGLSLFFLVFIRVYAKLKSSTPAILPAIPQWQAWSAQLMHVVLYAFMIGMPLLGWLILSAAGKPIPFFGLTLPALINENKEFAKTLKELHVTIGTVGYYIIGLHITAALFHHYIKKDNTLTRMLPRFNKKT